MRRMNAILAMAAIAAAALLAPPANAGMSSGTKVKVHRAQLRATMQKSQESGGPALETCKSGDLEIGTIQAERGARVPSDVTVVVDGDVINLNDGRSSHVCR